MDKLGKRLNKLRKEKGEKKEDIAELLRVDIQKYERYESDESNPMMSSIEKLADHFDVSIDYLLGRSSNPKGSFAEEIAIKEKNRFYKKFGDLIDTVTKARLAAAKKGRKTVNIKATVYKIKDYESANKSLCDTIKEIMPDIDVKVEFVDVGCPLGTVIVKVGLSWI